MVMMHHHHPFLSFYYSHPYYVICNPLYNTQTSSIFIRIVHAIMSGWISRREKVQVHKHNDNPPSLILLLLSLFSFPYSLFLPHLVILLYSLYNLMHHIYKPLLILCLLCHITCVGHLTFFPLLHTHTPCLRKHRCMHV